MSGDDGRSLSEWLRASEHPEWLVGEVASLEIQIWELEKQLLEAKDEIASQRDYIASLEDRCGVHHHEV